MKNHKFGYIDAVRGWAIVMVIAVHASFPGLPYPFKKLTNIGWHGVQLFFMASAITLLLSWRSDNRDFLQKYKEFIIRRFFRIAPLYYLGAIFYYFVNSSGVDFDWTRLLTTLFFINSWMPDWTPTTGGWVVVPGGWSISVEFCFYIAFPFLALIVSGLKRAGLLFLIALLAACFLNAGANQYLSDHYNDVAIGNFLYFWLPNQLPVFLLGFFGYYLIVKKDLIWMSTHKHVLAVGGLIVLVFLAEFYIVSPHYFSKSLAFPPMLWISFTLLWLVILLSKVDLFWLNFPLIRKMGTYSFSMYVLHFAVLDFVKYCIFGIYGHAVSGFTAIGIYVLVFGISLVTVGVVSAFSYRFIELPGIALGSFVNKRYISLR